MYYVQKYIVSIDIEDDFAILTLQRETTALITYAETGQLV